MQHQVKIQIENKGEFKKGNFTTHTQIAPVNAVLSSTEVQQCFYNNIQPWSSLFNYLPLLVILSWKKNTVF